MKEQVSKQSKKSRTRRILMAVSSVLLVVCLAGTAVLYPLAGSIDAFVLTPVADVSDEEKEETDAQAAVLAEEILAEGMVLLQNENDTLPLSKDVTRVNVFGWASTAWLGGGSGSGQISEVEVGFLDALEAYGIEYNTEITQMYRDFQDGRVYTDTLGCTPSQSAVLYEPYIGDTGYYTEELLKSAEEYSDTAIVVIGRLAGGESNDVPTVQYRVNEKGGEVIADESRTTLEFSVEEEALLSYVGAVYENVVVILNTTNVMAVGQLETIEGIDACLLVGPTGTGAASVIPSVLWGDISPSGRTADTWAYDLSTAASYADSGLEGVGAYEDADGLYPADGTENVSLGTGEDYYQVSYIDYAEGIYVGYRWYETADEEGFWDSVDNEYGAGYEGVVQYPFGYGLSYTSFEWEVVSAPEEGALPDAEGEISFTVKVTNTGEYPGKEVVQLYYTAPYIEGGIEKASVVLAAFAKTDTLEPGESQTLTLTCAVEDMASYDCYDANENGFCGYELDAGVYIFSLRTDTHTVSAAEGSTVALTLDEGVQYPYDSATGAEVGNLFTGEDASDGAALDGSDSGQDIIYLSRADFEGTFSHDNVDSRAMTDALSMLNLYEAGQEGGAADTGDTTGKEDVPENTDSAGAEDEDVTDVTFIIEENGIATELGYRLGENADDPLWEDLLDQISLEELEHLYVNGYGNTAAVDSIGKLQGTDADGPSQVGSFNRVRTADVGFPCSWTVAQTWNTDLALEMGRLQGRLALQNGYSGIYGPTANIHRSPLGGRNYEYYSEDSLLTGLMCGSTVQGIQEMGVYVYVKHFVGNDTEAGVYRDGVYTWMSEQTLREIYLEPFRIAVEDYDAAGIMTSYNRLGGIWAGGSYALITEVLRTEWGFEGAVITDYADHHSYMNGDQALLAGGSLWMSGFGGGTLEGAASSDVYEAALRRAAKEVLYMYLHVRVVNRDYVEASGSTALLRPAFHERVIGWRQLLLIADVVAAGLFLAALLWRKSGKAPRTDSR